MSKRAPVRTFNDIIYKRNVGSNVVGYSTLYFESESILIEDIAAVKGLISPRRALKIKERII